jgi:hypothetical protein
VKFRKILTYCLAIIIIASFLPALDLIRANPVVWEKDFIWLVTGDNISYSNIQEVLDAFRFTYTKVNVATHDITLTDFVSNGAKKFSGIIMQDGDDVGRYLSSSEIQVLRDAVTTYGLNLIVILPDNPEIKSLLGVQATQTNPINPYEQNYMADFATNDLCLSFSGSVGERELTYVYLYNFTVSDATVLATYNDTSSTHRPFFSVKVQSIGSYCFAIGTEFASLDERVGISRFISAILLGIALRDSVPSNRFIRPEYASIIVDDYSLQDLNFQQNLLSTLISKNARAAFAFIPARYQQTSPTAVSNFKANSDYWELIMHGNDHSSTELTTDYNTSIATLEQSIQRMESLKQSTGVGYEMVEIFPNEQYIVEDFQALRDENFLTSMSYYRYNGWDLKGSCAIFDFSNYDYPSMGRLGITSFNADTRGGIRALNLFHAPIIFYFHSDSLGSWLGQTIDFINSLGGVTWKKPSEIVSSAYDAKYDPTINKMSVVVSKVRYPTLQIGSTKYYYDLANSNSTNLYAVSSGSEPMLESLTGVFQPAFNLTGWNYADRQLRFDLLTKVGAVATASIYCGDQGQPSTVIINGVPTTFNYDAATKLVVFNVTASSTFNLVEVTWGPPSPPRNYWAMTFNQKDKDNNDVSSLVTWELYDGDQQLSYTEGSYTLLDGNYTIKTYYHGFLINETVLPTDIYGNSTIDIRLQMKAQSSVTLGYVASDNVIDNLSIASETSENLTFAISGSNPMNLIIDVPRNCSYIKKDGANTTNWQFVQSAQNYVIVNEQVPALLELFFPLVRSSQQAYIYKDDTSNYRYYFNSSDAGFLLQWDSRFPIVTTGIGEGAQFRSHSSYATNLLPEQIGYGINYWEYENVENLARVTGADEDAVQTIVVNASDFSLVKWTYSDAYMDHTYYYAFWADKPYYMVYIDRTMNQDMVVANSQTAHMLTSSMSKAYWTGYDGEIQSYDYASGSPWTAQPAFSALDSGAMDRYPFMAAYSETSNTTVGFIYLYTTPNIRKDSQFWIAEYKNTYMELQFDWGGEEAGGNRLWRDGQSMGVAYLVFVKQGDPYSQGNVADYSKWLFNDATNIYSNAETLWSTAVQRFRDWPAPEGWAKGVTGHTVYIANTIGSHPRVYYIPYMDTLPPSFSSQLSNPNFAANAPLYSKWVFSYNTSGQIELDDSRVDESYNKTIIGSDYSIGVMGWDKGNVSAYVHVKAFENSDKLMYYGNVTLDTDSDCLNSKFIFYYNNVMDVYQVSATEYDIRFVDPIYGWSGIYLKVDSGTVQMYADRLEITLFNYSTPEPKALGTYYAYNFTLWGHQGNATGMTSFFTQQPLTYKELYQNMILDNNMFGFANTPGIVLITSAYSLDTLTAQIMKLSSEQSSIEIYVGNSLLPINVAINDSPSAFSYDETTKILTVNITSSDIIELAVTLSDISQIPDTQPPDTLIAGVSSSISGMPSLFYSKWQDDRGLSGFIFSTNNTGVWINSTWTSLSTNPAWANVTVTLNSTVGLTIGFRWYCNDTSNNWKDTGIFALISLKADDQAPTYSSIEVNSTVASSPTQFSSYWTDNNGLSGYIFSTNNTGVWANDTLVGISGTGRWINVTKTLTSQVGAKVSYCWYVVDLYDNWNATEIQTLTTTYSATPQYSNVAYTSTTHNQPSTFSVLWTDDQQLSGYFFGSNVTGVWVNSTWSTLSGVQAWANTTLVLPSSIGVKVAFQWWCNDSQGQWTTTGLQYLVTTTTPPPTYTTITYNTTLAGEFAQFSCFWSDDVGLSGFVFSSNVTGVWANDTFVGLSGLGGWANVTKLLGGEVGMVVGFRWYCVDLFENWNATEIQTLTTTYSAAPHYSNVGYNSTKQNQPAAFSVLWMDDQQLSGYVFGSNVTGVWVNSTWAPLSGVQAWANVTQILPSLVSVRVDFQWWCNDSQGQWSTTGMQYLITTASPPPTYSALNYNTTKAGSNIQFSSFWTDDVGLSGFIFSWNGTGQWQNSTWTQLTGLSSWANTTKTIGSTVGTVIAFRWYCNDTDNNWNSTGVQLFTITSAVQPTNFGKTTIGASTTSVPVSYVVATRFQAPQSGTAVSVSSYIRGKYTTGLAKVLIYSDNNGAPGDLLYTSADITLLSSWAWHNFTVNYSLQAGTTYWFAVITSVESQLAYDTGSTNQLAVAWGWSYPNIPTKYNSIYGPSYANLAASTYVTYLPS